jgi:hypothetical protein
MADKEKTYYDEIRRRITKRYEARAQFYGHLVSFLIINVLLWTLLQPPQIGLGRTLLLGFSSLWTVGLAIHAVNFLFSEMRERAIEKAIERERQFQGTPLQAKGKRKRDAIARLSADGELLEVVDDDWEAEARANTK